MKSFNKGSVYRSDSVCSEPRMTEGTLDWLLGPITMDQFVHELWENRPHFIGRQDRSYFSSLFSVANFDTVLEYGKLGPPELRVVRCGERLSADDFMQSDGRPDFDQLRRRYAEGYTIVINRLESFWPPVAELVQAMQLCLSCQVQAYAYLTPGGSRGLRPHYDTHDVIVLQLNGAKSWRVYQEKVRFPLEEFIKPDGFSRDELPEPRVVEVTAGDTLYIPRGWVHEAETASGSSLHLSLVMLQPLWRDLMAKALEALTLRHEDLRRALPVGYLEDADAALAIGRKFEELADLLLCEGSVSEALGMLQDEFIRLGRARPDGQFVTDLDRLSSIDLDARLVKRPLLSCRVLLVDDGIAIQFGRSLIKGSSDYGESMEFVAGSWSAFAVSDLPGLNDKKKVAFAQQLVRDGLLRFAVKS